ncbi:MAG: hypothetical protein IJV35_11155 [Neisseriaceae bacterium]|nr:hypothetical protein [Neisseriaceae bacterium]MBQ9683809.1 hypothetical protein [Neisseriaceae bacterium]MBQ9725401.1 hypothetical protein [Neisseriaceae bacterium]MBR1818891.1 hypothetical protein [Neisseriaceae bacterium]
MSLEMAFNLLWGVFVGVAGLLYKNLLARLDRKDTADNRRDEQINHVLVNYMPRNEVQAALQRIESQLNRIYDKLDQKADKE